MADATLRSLLAKWQGEYAQLLDDASELLRNFDAYASGGCEELLARRQRLIDGFQKIDTELEKLGAGVDKARLGEFRTFQEGMTARILEIDALAIALGKEKLDFLKGKLSGSGRRKTMLTAYEQGATVIGRH